MASFIPYALALLLAVNAAFGLTCYECNSNTDTRCKWGITSFTYNTKDCASIGIFDNIAGAKCYKIKGEKKDGSNYVARGCLPPATGSGCSAIASVAGWFSSQSGDDDGVRNLTCDVCDTDKCNSSNMIKGLTVISLIIAASVFLF